MLASFLVFMLGTDGNLWVAELDAPSLSTYAYASWQIVPHVVDYQAVYDDQNGIEVFMLQTGGNLGYYNFVDKVIPFRARLPPVASNVAQFQAVGSRNVYVLDNDGFLWFTPGPFGDLNGSPNPRAQVDGNVQGFQAMDPQVMLIPGVYVLGNDNNLWFTPGPFVPNRPIPYPMRGQVDGSVAAFQALDSGTVFVAGTDGNLWYTPGFFLPGLPIPNPNRGQVDGNVAGANELSFFSPQLGGTFPPLPYYWR